MQPLIQDPYPDQRWTNIKIDFKVVDTDANMDATIATTTEAAISKKEQTVDESDGMTDKIGTLEDMYFLLDGTFTFPDEEDNGQVGWWSSGISDATGAFSTPEVLTFTFTKDHSSVGFTVNFDDKTGEIAEDFTIEVFNSSLVLMDSISVVGNTLVKYEADLPVDGYRSIAMTVTKTSNPYRRVRISEFVFGIVKPFDGSNLVDVSLLYSVDRIQDSQPSHEAVITIDNSNHEYNFINPASIYRYLQEGQTINVKMEIGQTSTETVNMGTFYYTEATAADGGMTAKITANDKLFLLDNSSYRKGLTGTGTVSDIVADIISDSGIALTVNIPSPIGNRVIGKSIPVVSHRQAIRMVAQAAMAIAYIDRENKLTFTELSTLEAAEVVDTLTLDEQYQVPSINIPERINVVEASGYSIRTEASVSEIYSGVIPINGTKTVWITYTSPASSVTPTIVGGTINSASYYLYACKLVISAVTSATLTLSGYKVEFSETVYRADSIRIGESEQVKTVQNQLVTNDLADDVAAWMLANYTSRLIYKVSERGNPARELGDNTKIYDAYGENKNTIITKEQYQFDGSLKCQTEALGKII